MGPVTQEDPIGIAGGLNLYGYANGDPINFSDPFGLCPWCIGAVVGFLVEGAAQVVTGDYSLTRLGAATALGAASGGLTVAKNVGTVFRYAGQMAIGASGAGVSAWSRGEALTVSDAIQGAGLGFAGEFLGDALTAAARSAPGIDVIAEFKGHWGARMGAAIRSGELSAADASTMTNAVMGVLDNRESEMAALFVGLWGASKADRGR
jgi:uncharacterized protein RhaS with RHS repeats